MDQREDENEFHHQKFKEPYFDNLITSSWDITLSFTD